MCDLVRIYVLFHPQSAPAAAYADAISRHFDSLGMERDGVQYRIPVRFRSEAFGAVDEAAAPRGIDLAEATHNAIVFLHDDLTQADQAIWDPYLSGLKACID